MIHRRVVQFLHPTLSQKNPYIMKEYTVAMFIMIESSDIEKLDENKSTEDNNIQFCKMRAQ